MANSLGKASLLLTANYAKLTGGLDVAYARVQSFKAKVLGAAGGGFATALGGNLFKDALSTAVALADVGRQAKAVGASSAGFMALGEAAKRAGVDAGQFGELLGKMGAKVGHGMMGGEAAKTLAQLGVSLESLAGLPADEQFLRIADAISKVPDASVQAGIATKLFEEQGLKLLPMLRQGEGGLRAFIAEQKRLGTALSDADMLKLEKVKAALPKLQAVFAGAWNKIVVAIAPLLETVATRVTRLFDNLRPVIDGLVYGFELVAQVAGGVLDEMAGWFDQIYATVSAWVGEATSGLDTFDLIRAVVEGIANGVARVGAFFGEVGRTAAAIGATVLQGWVMILDEVKGAMADLLRGFASIPGISELVGDEVKGWADSLEKTDFSKTARDLEQFADRNWFDTGRLAANVNQAEQWIGRAMKKKQELAAPTVVPLKPEFTAPTTANVLGAALAKGTAAEYSARVKAEVGGGSVLSNMLAVSKEQNAKLGQLVANTAARPAASEQKPQPLELKVTP